MFEPITPFISSAGQIVQTVVLPLRHCAAGRKGLMRCYKGEGEFAWCGGHVSVCFGRWDGKGGRFRLLVAWVVCERGLDGCLRSFVQSLFYLYKAYPTGVNRPCRNLYCLILFNVCIINGEVILWIYLTLDHYYIRRSMKFPIISPLSPLTPLPSTSSHSSPHPMPYYPLHF